MMTGFDDPFLRTLLDEIGLNCYETFSAFPATSLTNLVAAVDEQISKIRGTGSTFARLKQLNPNFSLDYRLSEKNIADIKEIHEAVHCYCLCGTNLEVQMKGDSQS